MPARSPEEIHALIAAAFNTGDIDTFIGLHGPGAVSIVVQKALALLQSGDVDADQLTALTIGARDRPGRDGTARIVAQDQTEVWVWEVLTVDVVEGRIQTVRIVRNPDKLRHL